MNELVSPEKREPTVFRWREWLTLALSLGLAVLWFQVFGLENLFDCPTFPALGATLPVFALFGLVFFYLGRRVQLSRSSVLLTLAALLLAASFTIYGDLSLRLINYPLCLGVSGMAIFSLSGKNRYPWHSCRVLFDTVALGFIAAFSHFFAPFRALGGLRRREEKGRLGGILLGLFVAVPLLAIVLALLMDADAVFGSLFVSFGDWMGQIRFGRSLWRALRTLVLTLLLFSALYSLTRPGWALTEQMEPGETEIQPEAEGKSVFTTSCLTALSLLNVVYALFVAVQFACLFGGKETAAMEGGYAAYARSGFFQLVAVAAINLCALLTAALAASRGEGRGKKAVQVMGCLLLGFTVVILISAAKRMGLYISVYGLTLLRALTIWGMAVIAVCLAAAGVKLYRWRLRFFALFFAVTLTSWILLNYVNLDARIASWNVNAYLRGSVEQVDADYLSRLSGDTHAALEKLYAAEPCEEYRRALERQEKPESVNWRCFCLADIR